MLIPFLVVFPVYPITALVFGSAGCGACACLDGGSAPPPGENVGMFEFHGWAVLQDGPGAEGGFPEGNVEAELRERVDVRRGGSALVDVRWVNAQLMLHFAGHSNHRGGSEDFVELFRWVAGRAPGAYGLLYFHDDEDPSEEQRDRFQVLTMARGRISERADPFLSPRTPVIEDELTWDDL